VYDPPVETWDGQLDHGDFFEASVVEDADEAENADIENDGNFLEASATEDADEEW